MLRLFEAAVVEVVAVDVYAEYGGLVVLLIPAAYASCTQTYKNRLAAVFCARSPIPFLSDRSGREVVEIQTQVDERVKPESTAAGRAEIERRLPTAREEIEH